MSIRYVLIASIALAAGCSDPAPLYAPDRAADSGDEVTDTGTDTPADDVRGSDVASDVAEDLPQVELDTTPDSTRDAPNDVAPEVDAEGDVSDVEPDTARSRWQSGDPAAEGPYGVSETSQRIDFGPREMETLFFVPSDDADAPYPVVVFNHGFQMSADAYAGYGRRLASHGFVFVMPTVGDTLMGAATHVELGELQVAVNDWIYVSSPGTGTPIAGLADPGLLGVGGHSRGGKQSILAATEDDRIVATFNVDPVDAGPPFGGNEEDYPSVTPERMGALTIPSGYVGAGRGGEASMGPACAPTEDNYRAYFEASPSPSFEWLIAGAGHNDFVESCDFICELACPEGDDPASALAFAQTTMVAFYKVFLAGDESYRSWIDGDEVRGAMLSVR